MRWFALGAGIGTAWLGAGVITAAAFHIKRIFRRLV